MLKTRRCNGDWEKECMVGTIKKYVVILTCGVGRASSPVSCTNSTVKLAQCSRTAKFPAKEGVKTALH